MPEKKRKKFRERNEASPSPSSRACKVGIARLRHRDNRSTGASGTPPFPHQIFGASKSGACHQGLHDNDAFPFPVSKIHRGVYIACANLIKLDNFERLRTAGRDGDMGSEEAALFVRGLVLSTGPRCLVVLC
jgi:hypothetical protein